MLTLRQRCPVDYRLCTQTVTVYHVFSSVLSIRQKKAKHKKLEKNEQEFYRENKSLIDMQPRYSAEEQAEIDRLNEMLK